ncbi:sodium/potassium/calcium exchanger 6, mitochondrial-like [Fopius arisanus]|uniref:Sodium/potassium/calcium exchanger 6, mitochondrial-like n=1 Tax=Fopius arisanus TaxID=64838 RepID=A0A9R1TA99_9HYME|nr:PREDICTED: sodium/potassium/calcium exchanger 6, mitochondrial-like [Fopius arisanus]
MNEPDDFDPKYGGLQIREDDCSYVWQITPEDRCEWVKTSPHCESDSIIQYSTLLFCTFSSVYPGLFAIGIIIIILWLLYLFLILGTVADNFFCPSLSVIANVLHLSENIAGVTILAFGNGAPDIFTSLVASDKEMVIIFTELIGAGIFVTAIIAGSVAVVSPFAVLPKPFVRDCLFYIVAVCWISYISYDEMVHLWEALSFVVIYILFIATVVGMQYYDNREEKRKAKIPGLQDPEMLKTFLAYEETDSDMHLPMRSTAFSVKAKLDVAIAAEMANARARGESIGIDNRRSSSGSSRSHRPVGLFHEFLYDLNPINLHDWQKSSILVRSLLVLRAPAMIVLQLLVPVVNETAINHGWSKLLNSLQLCTAPIAVLFKLNLWRNTIGPVPVALVFLVLGAIFGVAIFIMTGRDKPKYHNAFAFLGFISAMLVVYVVANEVMAVLQCVGFASGISDAMLGITLLAWGNSVGDLISNVAIARRGFPRMGYSACFGGPLFNTLLGLGLTWTVSTISKSDYRTKIRTSDMMPGCLAFLLCTLVSSLIYLNTVGFRARKSYGFLLYSIYFVFMLVNFLSEIHYIHPLGTDHRED